MLASGYQAREFRIARSMPLARRDPCKLLDQGLTQVQFTYQQTASGSSQQFLVQRLHCCGLSAEPPDSDSASRFKL